MPADHAPTPDLAALSRATAAELRAAAEAMTLDGFGPVVTYSPKVFVPLTKLCRDVCHYCAFSTPPSRLTAPFMSLDDVLAIARQGRDAGCLEALFTLGDKPEARFPVAAEWLAHHGYASTLDYVAAAAGAVFRETGLLPHINAGITDSGAMAALRPVSASMGLMLETTAARLSERGAPHHGSPDKDPSQRIAMLRAAGELGIPTTTGILVGIGETRAERIEALIAIRDLHAAHGHIQDVIIQNFRAKPATRMANAPEPPLDEHLWSISAARLILGPRMSIQVPPNLAAGPLAALIAAGINDWGGVSPVTLDHVNPEAPWPEIAALEAATAGAGRALVPRLAITPGFARDAWRWAAPAVATAVLRLSDAEGFARSEAWSAGSDLPVPRIAPSAVRTVSDRIRRALANARGHAGPSLADAEALFAARGYDFDAVLGAADEARAEQAGDVVTFVVNRNINYANICSYGCAFCAFSKSPAGGGFRDPPYVLSLDAIAHRADEAWLRGATEVCLQGGIHPDFDGGFYLDVVRTIREAAPDLHVHAFSPLEVVHGARTLGVSLERYLRNLKRAGLRSLPGTAAEILDDGVRDALNASKIDTGTWIDVMRTAHRIGLRSTATIMFGHVDAPRHWARHLLRIRALQAETGGFTELVPLPFVHFRAPIWRRGHARGGPTWREALLMHAVARLVLGPLIRNIQVSWTKLGADGAAACLRAGANDLGGTLMNESITRAAGGTNGQGMDTADLIAIARSAGRPAAQRATDYRPIAADLAKAECIA
jgi:FO synthase